MIKVKEKNKTRAGNHKFMDEQEQDRIMWRVADEPKRRLLAVKEAMVSQYNTKVSMQLALTQIMMTGIQQLENKLNIRYDEDGEIIY